MAALVLAGLTVAVPAAWADGVWRAERFAGTDLGGDPVEGPGRDSPMQVPAGVATDSEGNVYVADAQASRVYRISPLGRLAFFAGTGTQGAPVAGEAMESPLLAPAGIAVDSSDNVYVTDALAHQVLKVTQNGVLSIVAGTGEPGEPAPGPAADSPLGLPGGVAVSSTGAVYVADFSASEVVEVSAGNLRIIAGTGTGGPATPGPSSASALQAPTGLAVDQDDNLYIADTGNNRVERVSHGSLAHFAGDGTCDPVTEGTATSVHLCSPVGLATRGGVVYLADAQDRRVVAVAGAMLSFYAGSGADGDPGYGAAMTSVPLGHPLGLAAGSATLYLSLVGESPTVTRLGDPIAPDRPSGVAATPTATKAGVTWTAPALDGWSPITGYTVTATPPTGPAVTVSAGPSATSATVTGLTNDLLYSVTVSATNDAGTGLPSEAVTVTPRTVPAVVSFTALVGDTKVDLTWSAPDDGGSPITGYLLRATPVVPGDPVNASAGPSATSGSITGLDNGRAYRVSIAATNAAGTGPWAPETTITPLGPPEAPSQLHASPSDRSALLSFLPPESDGGSAITGYQVTADGTTWWPVNTWGTSPIWTNVGGLTNGTPSNFRVRAVNTIGDGDPSQPVTVTPRTTPGSPTDVTASAGSARAMVSWMPPVSDGGAAVTGYTVRAVPAGDHPVVRGAGGPDDMMTTLTGLVNDVEYTVTVAAINPAGIGSWSDPALVEPTDPPATVSEAGMPTKIHVGARWVTLPVTATVSHPRTWVNVTLDDSSRQIAWTTLTRDSAGVTFSGSLRLAARSVVTWGAHHWTWMPQGPSSPSTVDASVRLHSLLGLSAARRATG